MLPSRRAPDLVDQGLIEVTLGIEVLIQHRLGDPDRIGDVVHRRTVEARTGEDREGDVENLFSTGGGGESLRHVLPDGNPK